MQKKPLEITCYVCGAGAFGVFFRWLQVMLAFDDQGLNEKSAFNVLVPLMILAAAWVFRRFVREYRSKRLYVEDSFCEALFNPGRLFTAARFAAGGIMCIGAVLLLLKSETDVNAGLIRLLCLLAFLTGASFPFVLDAANYEYLAHEELVRLGMLLPIVMNALWLVLSYKQNAYNSVPWSYAVEMFAIISAMVGFFRIAGFAYHVVDQYKCFFWLMLGAAMCIMALADSRYMGMQLIFLASAMMLVIYNWVLVMNMKKKAVQPKAEAKVDNGGFEQL